MTDFADQGAQAADLYLDLAIRQHVSRCTRTAPHPTCCFCEDAPVQIFHNGVKSKYCAECQDEATL